MYCNVPAFSHSACQRHEPKPALRIQPRRLYAMLAPVAICCFAFVATLSAQQNNTINTVAGQAPYSPTATLTSIPNPTGIAEDAGGNIYIASQYSYYVYKVNPSTGILSVVAGTGIFGFSPDTPAPVASTPLSSVVAVAVDKSANVYIIDGNRIKVVNTQPSATITVLGVNIPAGDIATVAGSLKACQDPTGSCGDGGPALNALFFSPQALYIDGSGNLFIADTNDQKIRFINTGSNPVTVTGVKVPAGTVATLAGNGSICNAPGDPCGDNGPATAPGSLLHEGAKLDLPLGVVTDNAGNVYIADTRDQRIRCVANVPAGCPNTAYLNASGTFGHVGTIITYAGQGAPFCDTPTNGCGDGDLKSLALFHNPSGLWIDSASNLYVADQWDNRIRVVLNTSGKDQVETVCGTGTQSFQSGKCSTANSDNNGAEFYGPLAVILDSAGNLTVADSGNSLIRQGHVAPGSMNTVAGSGTTGVGDGGAATSASLANPVDVKWDLTGTNYYIVDNANNRIREVTVNGNTSTISTVVGTGNPSQWCTEPPPMNCNGDYGLATAATLDNPNGIAFDSSGNMYIADSSNSAVRVVNTQPPGNPITVVGVTIQPGEIATVAGQMGVECLGEPACGDGGPATAGNVNYPIAVAVDLQGNLYIADYFLSRIRCVANVAGACPNTEKVNGQLLGPTVVGEIVSIAGTIGGRGQSHNNIPANSAKLLFPYGLGVTTGGVIFDDSGNSEVRCVALVANGCGLNTKTADIYDYALTGAPGFSGDGGPATQATENVPQGLGFDPAGNLYFGGGADFVVRRVDASTQNLMTVAGNTQFPGTPGFAGDGGPSVATGTTLYMDNLGLAVSGNEFLLIADDGNNRIRQVDMVPVVALPVQKLNFGTVQVGGTSTQQTASMQNYGLATLPISSTVLSDTTDFQIVQGSNTCVTQLPPGPATGQHKSLCSVNVVFTPQSTGTFNATLTFNTSLGPEVVKLTGIGD